MLRTVVVSSGRKKTKFNVILTKWVRKSATADRLLYPLNVLFLKPSLYKPKKKKKVDVNSFIVKTVCFISYKIISHQKKRKSHEVKVTFLFVHKK